MQRGIVVSRIIDQGVVGFESLMWLESKMMRACFTVIEQAAHLRERIAAPFEFGPLPDSDVIAIVCRKEQQPAWYKYAPHLGKHL